MQPVIEDQPADDDLAVLRRGVFEFGRAQAVGSDARPIASLVRDGNVLVAGARGRTEFGRLFVEYLWVAEPLRGGGLGTRVLLALEDAARKRGCRDSMIETLGDRTAALYARLGYRELASIPNYVGWFTRRVLLKPLASRSCDHSA